MDISTLLVGLIAGLGIGSVIRAWVQYLLRKKEVTYESQRKDIEARYKVIILLMYAAYDFDSNKASLRMHRPDLRAKEDVLSELNAEWHNVILFASVKTLEALRDFGQHPSRQNLGKTAFAMRSDQGRYAPSIKL